MNLREGTRRLALLLGVIGLILGGFVSYFQLQSTMSQRANHQRFERLANSALIKKAENWIALPQGQRDEVMGRMTPEQKRQLAGALGFNGTSSLSHVGEINQDGIKSIYWTTNHQVDSIETLDGQTLYSTPAPGAWSYLLIGIFPVLGFFIPWAAVRAVGWVVAGFV